MKTHGNPVSEEGETHRTVADMLAEIVAGDETVVRNKVNILTAGYATFWRIRLLSHVGMGRFQSIQQGFWCP